MEWQTATGLSGGAVVVMRVWEKLFPAKMLRILLSEWENVIAIATGSCWAVLELSWDNSFPAKRLWIDAALELIWASSFRAKMLRTLAFDPVLVA